MVAVVEEAVWVGGAEGVVEIAKRTHKESNTMLYTDYAGFEYFGAFVQRLYASHKPGDKFYIGGILDYHW